jgi:hypothetical protein
MLEVLVDGLGLRTITLPRLARAFAQARRELAEVGLLERGKYLDRIACVLSPLPTGYGGEMGWVFDAGPGYWAVLGYRSGVIYVPPNPPVQAHVPGGTLLDTLRHELGHAWAWLDLRHVDGPWFRETFGARYHAEWAPGEQPAFDPDAFVSDYACCAPKEDFAETFMFFLRYRRSLDRFRSRKRLHRKLRAVQAAVRVAARERVHRVRGPRD